MELKLAADRIERKIDHLALFDVPIDKLKKAKAIKGHKWVQRQDGSGYNYYPVNSLWAIMATFPGVNMTPGMKKYWDKMNGIDTEIDIYTPRDIYIPDRFLLDQLPLNPEGEHKWRPYQVAAIEEAWRVRKYILALDTRLGKTATYIALHLLLQEELDHPVKSMIITPNKGKWTIDYWARRLINDPMITTVHGSNAGKRALQIKEFLDNDNEMLIISYDSWVTHFDEYWEYVNDSLDAIFVDESHYIRNENSIRSSSVRCLSNPEMKIMGSATPQKRDVSDLYPQLNYANPDFFPCEWDGNKLVKSGRDEFEKVFCEKKSYQLGNGAWKTEIVGYTPQVKYLMELIHNTMIRVKFEDVTEQMPPQEIPVFFDLTKSERSIYQDIIEGAAEEWQHSRNPMIIAQRLRRAATHPRLVGYDIIGSALFEACGVVERYDEPIIVFSEAPDVIRDFAKIIEHDTNKTYITMLADDDEQERFRKMQMFQNGEVDLFLTTIGVANEAIQLDRSNIVLFIDGTYDAMDMLQAIRRAANPDKKVPLTIIYMMAKDTYHSDVWKIRETKGINFAFWIDKEQISEEDINEKAIHITALENLLDGQN